MEIVLEAGADDFNLIDNSYEILTTPSNLSEIIEALNSKGIEMLNAESTMRAEILVKLDQDSLENLQPIEDISAQLKEITETISHYYKVPSQSYDEAFDKYLASGQKKDSEYYDGQKDWSSEHAYLGRFAPEDEEDENESIDTAYKNLVTEWNKQLDGIE